MAAQEIVADTDQRVSADLLIRHDKPGPRYTSYPTAPTWSEFFGDPEYRHSLSLASLENDAPLSLYVHIPFCSHRCAFCGCNVIISKSETIVDKYLRYLDREIEMVAQALGPRRRVNQLHWGGGTPTFLTNEQMQRLFDSITRHFQIEPGAEVALEVDPRVTSLEQIRKLRELGFRRVSMGVQDLDPEVQAAIDRNQTEEQTSRLVQWCRDEGMESVNIDLVYGLPKQTHESWTRTIESVIALRPDRMAVYSYAHLPDSQHNQRKINSDDLPRGAAKYELLALARSKFVQAGYRAIGMDHFALPDDELSIAVDQRRLSRNFMGYTVKQAPDMIGFGTSAIGEVGGALAQNEKKLSRYFEAIEDGRMATARGIELTHDDQIRAWVIREITCNFHLDFSELQNRWDVKFEQYFEAEREELAALANDGFLSIDDHNISVKPLGQIFVRNIAMVFDAYLRSGFRHAFSRTV
ncbi:MAG: oxygen-independent coproporphyrinogen III oxidase [Candidatus Hydrogenedentes bacterium]|nr:oxygen-independent coproporphyrinogen III oxidase [Candidatus Hydrogenedentota bacterium]